WIYYIEWILSEEKIRPSNSDVIGNQSPFYFDNSVLDIYLCFFTGVTLVLIPEEKFLFPKELLEYIDEKKINYIFWVPTLLSNVAKNKALENLLPKLDKILFAGEIMPTRDLNYWIKKYPNATFANLYGPTEITVDCTFYVLNRNFRDDEILPIGKSCRNTQILLLDENNKLINVAYQTGEICVRGSSLSLGYYNDIEKTNQSFIQNPIQPHYNEKIYKTGDIGYYNENFELITTGRKDYQIKHNGYRIELGEIETALRDLENIQALCVIYDTKDSEIVLFYESEKELSKADIFTHLKNKLPKYMYPQKLLRVQSMPLNPNGKIDRIALKDMNFKTKEEK
ncbi:AMP-binding protein, partial [Helicobacter cappadocius]